MRQDTKNPTLSESWFIAGLLNDKQGNGQKAVSYYKKSIQLFTNNIKDLNESMPKKNKFMNLAQSLINHYKLKIAVSKKFIGDLSYLTDLDEFREGPLSSHAGMLKLQSNEQIKTKILATKYLLHDYLSSFKDNTLISEDILITE